MRRRVVLLSGVVGAAVLQRRRLVAILTRTTGTWVGTPPELRAEEPASSPTSAPGATAP
jgi:hypothetical protein